LPVCWNARFADAAALKERKEVKTLTPHPLRAFLKFYSLSF
jgi:hypothetical protein